MLLALLALVLCLCRVKSRRVLCAAQMQTRKKITDHGKRSTPNGIQIEYLSSHANPNPFDGDSALCVLLVQSCSFQPFQVVRKGRYFTVERIPLGLASRVVLNLPNNVCSFLNSTVLSVLYSATNVVVLGRFL